MTTKTENANGAAIFGPDLDRAVEEAVADFLENHWLGYMALVKLLEDHPANQPGADKTWVERRLAINRLHYQKASRPR